MNSLLGRGLRLRSGAGLGLLTMLYHLFSFRYYLSVAERSRSHLPVKYSPFKFILLYFIQFLNYEFIFNSYRFS
jgi:hypothetical protein